MIKNLIFDVGDVLIEYRWREMLYDHGVTGAAAERIGPELFEARQWRELDAGEISVEEAIREYQALFPEDSEVIAWFLRNAQLMVVQRPELWDKIEALKKRGYGIYLLSNYCKELFDKHTAGAGFLNDLDGGVISYQIHKTKPDPGIYSFLLQKYGLNPSECLFFDDRAENVEAAQKLGITAVQITSREKIGRQLDQLLQKD